MIVMFMEAMPKSWWIDHRPLVLQTGALGPHKSKSPSFDGFRMILVENNVINKIHFVSMEELEKNQYQLEWIGEQKPQWLEPALHMTMS